MTLNSEKGFPLNCVTHNNILEVDKKSSSYWIAISFCEAYVYNTMNMYSEFSDFCQTHNISLILSLQGTEKTKLCQINKRWTFCQSELVL